MVRGSWWNTGKSATVWPAEGDSAPENPVTHVMFPMLRTRGCRPERPRGASVRTSAAKVPLTHVSHRHCVEAYRRPPRVGVQSAATVAASGVAQWAMVGRPAERAVHVLCAATGGSVDRMGVIGSGNQRIVAARTALGYPAEVTVAPVAWAPGCGCPHLTAAISRPDARAVVPVSVGLRSCPVRRIHRPGRSPALAPADVSRETPRPGVSRCGTPSAIGSRGA